MRGNKPSAAGSAQARESEKVVDAAAAIPDK
jgi:hypothetical protein